MPLYEVRVHVAAECLVCVEANSEDEAIELATARVKADDYEEFEIVHVGNDGLVTIEELKGT